MAGKAAGTNCPQRRIHPERLGITRVPGEKICPMAGSRCVCFRAGTSAYIDRKTPEDETAERLCELDVGIAITNGNKSDLKWAIIGQNNALPRLNLDRLFHLHGIGRVQSNLYGASALRVGCDDLR